MFGWVINIFRAARSNLKILDSYVNKDIRKIINVSLFESGNVWGPRFTSGIILPKMETAASFQNPLVDTGTKVNQTGSTLIRWHR